MYFAETFYRDAILSSATKMYATDTVRSRKYEPEKNNGRDMRGLCYSIANNNPQSCFCNERKR